MTITEQAVELLPCPFCGSMEVSASVGGTGDGKPWHYIECESCAASAEPDVWNKRAAQPLMGVQRPEDVAAHDLVARIRDGLSDTEHWQGFVRALLTDAANTIERLVALPHAGQPQEGGGTGQIHRLPDERFGELILHDQRGADYYFTSSRLAEYVDKCRAAWEAQRSASPPPSVAESGWQKIETAPIDGTVIDLWCRSPGINSGGYGRIPDCWCSVGKWYRYDEQHGDDMCRTRVHNATHWMPRPADPLPAPPHIADQRPEVK